MTPRHLRFAGLLAVLSIPPRGDAQTVPGPRREIPGFDFRKDGAWRRWAREVQQNRARLFSQGAFRTLNAPMAAGVPLGSAQAVSGVLKVPVVLFQFRDIAAQHAASEYSAVLFGSTPPWRRPYTYRTFYQQMSNNLLDIQGQAYGPVTLDSNEITYAGTPPCTGSPFPGGTNCNGLFSNSQVPGPVMRMLSGLREALQKVDVTVDFSQYADTSGYVPLVVFIQSALDGACGGTTNNHLWSHRFNLYPPYVTNDPDPYHLGQNVKISDYTLQSGLGGGFNGCDQSQIMPIGTVAHETGHGFGLPDLYDTGFTSEGVGEYSLMGSGNYTSPLSPSRMDAWSLQQLGWIKLAPLATSGAYRFGAVPTSDTVFLVRPTGANPRNEYFLLENRQAVASDSAMIARHCSVSGLAFPGSCGGGLLIWHIDSTQIAQHGFTQDNAVNAGPIHGLELEQADGRGNLDANPATSCQGAGVGCSNRGDGGDPYPGVFGNTALTAATRPNDLLNTGTCSGFRLDSIAQIVPNGIMRFVLSIGSGVDSLLITTAAQLTTAQWGYSYGGSLNAACGTGSYAWAVDSGALPPVLTLSVAGVLSGAPRDTGTYTFRASVTSGARTVRRVFTLRVNEPMLTLQQVLDLAFQGPRPASDDQRRYLDLQNNADGTFDIGDFLRWLARTGNLAAAGAWMHAARSTP